MDLRLVGTTLLCLSWTLSAAGQCQLSKLTGDEISSSEDLGFSVAVDGPVAVVGGFFHASQTGWVYVYRYEEGVWTQEQRLTASDGAAQDWFGRSVDVSGDVIVVGAFGDDDASGSAYVYRYDGNLWMEEQKLQGSRVFIGDFFGGAGPQGVSISGDVIAVAAENDFADRGAVYVFRYDGVAWAEEQMLTASNGWHHDAFGSSISLSGDVLLVGASGGGPSIDENYGSAYVFRFNGVEWIEEQELPNTEPPPATGGGEPRSQAALPLNHGGHPSRH